MKVCLQTGREQSLQMDLLSEVLSVDLNMPMTLQNTTRPGGGGGGPTGVEAVVTTHETYFKHQKQH